MAANFDAKATAVKTQASYTSPLTNTTLTIGATGTLVIGVFTAYDTTTLAVPTAMTWNSVAMTLIGNKADSSGDANVYVYALVAPATGNQTLSCTFTNGTGTTPELDLDCFSFKGTDTTSVATCIPSGNVLTDATSPATANYPVPAFAVTTASGDAMCAVCNGHLVSPLAAAVGTLINIENATNINYGSLYNLAVGATTNGQFTASASSTPMCGVAFRIVQASSAAFIAKSMQTNQAVKRAAYW